MDSDHKSSSIPERVRYLNIVYFVESARSHTLRINLRHAKWAIAGVLVLCVWSFGSIIWILSLKHQITGTRTHLESALSTVFDYQIKNDKVFELAYPIDATNSYYSEAAQLASNNPVSDKRSTIPETNLTAKENKSPDKDVAQESQQTAPIKVSPEKSQTPSVASTSGAAPAKQVIVETVNEKSLATDTAAKSKSPRDDASGKLIGISSPRVSKTGPKMVLEFSITNSNPKRAEGYIWAVANIQTASGQIVRIIAPEHAKLDRETGEIAAFKAAYRFSIQRFKEKSFDFAIPSGVKEWKLTKLIISFSDLNATRTDQVELPVESLAVTHQSDTNPTDLKL